MVDSTHTALYKFRNQNEAQQELLHKFTSAGDTTFTAIDQKLIKRYNITDQDWNKQFATENETNIVISIVISKNKTAGSVYQANPADDSEDSGLDYQQEHV